MIREKIHVLDFIRDMRIQFRLCLKKCTNGNKSLKKREICKHSLRLLK